MSLTKDLSHEFGLTMIGKSSAYEATGTKIDKNGNGEGGRTVGMKQNHPHKWSGETCDN
ncbi:MAG: hypothetical protein KBF76_21095 [Verrucomicrobiales bacterium]|nr:hypothetical protein [Verrucomicrobiales bacterium]